jgi:hypothetical protein
MPLIRATNFEKSHGAPGAGENPKRSSPQNELDMTGKLGTKQNRKPRTPTSTF